MTGLRLRQSIVGGVALMVLSGSVGVARAQIRGVYAPGMTATNSAVLPASGLTYQQLFQLYTFDKLKGPGGAQFPVNATFSLFADQNIFVGVTKHKMLGGTYAALADVTIAGNALSTAAFGALAGGASLGDSYFAPLVLGWQKTRVDLEGTVGFMAPTGRFHASAIDNTGVGYWTMLPTFAETFYLRTNKRTTVSAFEAYEFHADQKDTNIHPGQTFDLDYSLMHMEPLDKQMRTLLQFGLVGYGQYQTTDRSGPGVDPIIAANNRYRVNALGVGLNVLLPARKSSVGVKWFKEFSNQSTVEGQSLQISLAITF